MHAEPPTEEPSHHRIDAELVGRPWIGVSPLDDAESRNPVVAREGAGPEEHFTARAAQERRHERDPAGLRHSRQPADRLGERFTALLLDQQIGIAPGPRGVPIRRGGGSPSARHEPHGQSRHHADQHGGDERNPAPSTEPHAKTQPEPCHETNMTNEPSLDKGVATLRPGVLPPTPLRDHERDLVLDLVLDLGRSATGTTRSSSRGWRRHERLQRFGCGAAACLRAADASMATRRRRSSSYLERDHEMARAVPQLE